MVNDRRRLGIGLVDDIPWGTHFCHFYETKEDLFDILIPYFKTGLEDHEFCMWVVFEPLDEQEARSALERAFPGAAGHLAAHDIEIVPHSQWYLKDGAFDLQQVLHGWDEKLAQALARGYAGMRVNGNETWLTEKDWRNFVAYENELNQRIANRRMIVVCTYPLAATGAAQIFDVAHTHQFAIAKRGSTWEIVEIPELRHAKEKALAASEERFRRYFELGVIGMAITSPTKGWVEVNDQLCEFLGYERSELLQMTWADLTHPDDLAADIENFNRVLASEIDGYSIDKRFVRKDGQVIYTTISVKCLRRRDGSVDYFVALAQDITERKRAEEELHNSFEQLRALAARLQSAREEERTRVAREIHYELGQALTAIKLDVASLIHELPPDQRREKKAESILKLVGRTIQFVRRLSTELRPGMLDDLGLVAAVEWAAEEFETRTGTKCRLDPRQSDIVTDREQSTAIFRIFQETLTNVTRHANATQVDVRLRKDDGYIVFEVRDNGCGIAKKQLSAGGFGILGMRERAILLGGEFTIDGVPGKGTLVRVRIPEAGPSCTKTGEGK